MTCPPWAPPPPVATAPSEMQTPMELLEALTLSFLLGAAGHGPVLSRRSLSHCTLYFHVVEFLYRNLLHGNNVTQRDLYYLVSSHASHQGELNRVLLQIGAATGLSRSQLLVSAGARGSIAGCIRLGDVDVSAHPNGVLIPGSLAAASGAPPIECWGRFLLIVEKDAVFQRLVAERFFAQVPCVLLTGRGFPDLATRAMARLLVDRHPAMVVVGLADYNPSGVHVLLQYRCGNRAVPESLPFAVPQLRWLGLHGADVPVGERHVPLARRDTGQLVTLLRRLRSPPPTATPSAPDAPPSAAFPPWADELERMRAGGFKAELESIGSHSGAISAFVRAKLLRDEYI